MPMEACRQKTRMPLHKFLDQEPAPVFTAIAVVTSAVVWTVLVAVPALGPKDWGALAAFVLTRFVLIAGLLINVCGGLIATARGEYWGGRIAAMGIALWFVTVAVLVGIRKHA
jgi:hypothetical protein